MASPFKAGILFICNFGKHISGIPDAAIIVFQTWICTHNSQIEDAFYPHFQGNTDDISVSLQYCITVSLSGTSR